MKTTVDQVGTNKVKLTVEVAQDDLAPFVDRTYKKLAGEIRVPGFRPGKVPKPIIDQRLGKEFVRTEALKEALPELLSAAVTDAELDVVAPPEVNVTSFEEGQDLQFEAVCETRPDPELKDYSGLEVTQPSEVVTDDEVEEQVKRLQARFASLEVVPRPARKEDFALIDLKTYRHEQVIDEATAKDLLVEVGADMIVPELDAELEGKRKGDILKITTTLPERFGEHAGLQVGMQVLVKDVKARKLPELNDEFAGNVSEFDTLDELRADLRSRLEEVKKVQADMQLRENVVEAFVERGVSIDLPDGMVEMEVDRLIVSMARALQAQGATIDQYLQAENIDGDALRQRLRPQAERNLTLRLGLESLAKAESIEATDEDRDKEVQRLADATEQTPEQVRSQLDEGGNWGSVDGDIIRSKALDLLVSRAKITTEEGQA